MNVCLYYSDGIVNTMGSIGIISYWSVGIIGIMGISVLLVLLVSLVHSALNLRSLTSLWVLIFFSRSSCFPVIRLAVGSQSHAYFEKDTPEHDRTTLNPRP